MKVFISWSGTLSKEVAQLLSSWIQDVLQGTETWISTDDIDKGSLWFSDTSRELSDTSVGILCLTRENISAPWILFEAGALSKGLSKSRVCPMLVNLSHTDLKPPLSQFTGTLPTREDMLKLISTINAQNGENALSGDRLAKAFDRWWDEFEKQFTAILKTYKPPKEVHRRPLEDMVEEILQVVRAIQNAAQQEGSARSFIVHGSPGMGKVTTARQLAPLLWEQFLLERGSESEQTEKLTDIEKSLIKMLLVKKVPKLDKDAEGEGTPT